MKMIISTMALLISTYAFGMDAETPCPAMDQESREKIIDVKTKVSSSSQGAVKQ